jgi:hypothetical protein
VRVCVVVCEFGVHVWCIRACLCVCAFVFVRSWVNEKRPGVSVNHAVWASTFLCVVVFFAIGIPGAMAFQDYLAGPVTGSCKALPDTDCKGSLMEVLTDPVLSPKILVCHGSCMHHSFIHCFIHSGTVCIGNPTLSPVCQRAVEDSLLLSHSPTPPPPFVICRPKNSSLCIPSGPLTQAIFRSRTDVPCRLKYNNAVTRNMMVWSVYLFPIVATMSSIPVFSIVVKCVTHCRQY